VWAHGYIELRLHRRRWSILTGIRQRLIGFGMSAAALSGAINPQLALMRWPHELRHAWQSHFGRPADDEGDANNASSFSVDFHAAVDGAGGEAALMRFDAGGNHRHGLRGRTIWLARSRGAVPGVRRKLFGGAGDYRAAKFNGASGSLHISRALYCDFCGHVQRLDRRRHPRGPAQWANPRLSQEFCAAKPCRNSSGGIVLSLGW